MTDVRRHEESFRIRLDEHRLHAVGRRAPDRESAVAVMVRQDHDEGPLVADEERRGAVAEPLAALGEPKADSPYAFEHPLPVTHPHIPNLRK
jgi:hypothetical protein